MISPPPPQPHENKPTQKKPFEQKLIYSLIFIESVMINWYRTNYKNNQNLKSNIKI